MRGTESLAVLLRVPLSASGLELCPRYPTMTGVAQPVSPKIGPPVGHHCVWVCLGQRGLRPRSQDEASGDIG